MTLPSRARALLLAAGLLLAALAAGAQTGTHTPAPGSAERAALLDAVRRHAQARLKGQPVRFRVEHLRVRGAWAFLQAEPLRADGRPLEYRGTPYEAAVEAGAFDALATALLRRERGGWRVVAFDLGATDVVWEPWPGRFGAPREIFPSWTGEPPAR